MKLRVLVLHPQGPGSMWAVAMLLSCIHVLPYPMRAPKSAASLGPQLTAPLDPK